MTGADNYRNAVRGMRFAKMRPGFDAGAALNSLKALAGKADAENELSAQEIGVQQYDAGADARRVADMPKAGFSTAMGGDESTKRIMADRQKRYSDAHYMGMAKEGGYDPNFGVPRMLGSGDTIGQGPTQFGSTDVTNAQTEAESPLGQARGRQIMEALRRSRAGGY